jgi:two-component system chemotaxis response regulator CheB
MAMGNMQCKTIVIGGSAGSFEALTTLLPRLPANLPVAVIVIIHRIKNSDNYLTEYFGKICHLRVENAENLECIAIGTIYIAPPDYHLLITDDFYFNLTQDPAVNFSRPSIDVTFESAADVYAEHLLGIVLTGANYDGALGLKKIKMAKGYTMVQDPQTAQVQTMPAAAINETQIDFIGSLQDIAQKICDICKVELVTNGK